MIIGTPGSRDSGDILSKTSGNIKEAYLPKISISGQIVSDILAGYTEKTP